MIYSNLLSVNGPRLESLDSAAVCKERVLSDYLLLSTFLSFSDCHPHDGVKGKEEIRGKESNPLPAVSVFCPVDLHEICSGHRPLEVLHRRVKALHGQFYVEGLLAFVSLFLGIMKHSFKLCLVEQNYPSQNQKTHVPGFSPKYFTIWGRNMGH
jgi:hypothetical protein